MLKQTISNSTTFSLAEYPEVRNFRVLCKRLCDCAAVRHYSGAGFRVLGGRAWHYALDGACCGPRASTRRLTFSAAFTQLAPALGVITQRRLFAKATERALEPTHGMYQQRNRARPGEGGSRCTIGARNEGGEQKVPFCLPYFCHVAVTIMGAPPAFMEFTSFNQNRRMSSLLQPEDMEIFRMPANSVP